MVHYKFDDPSVPLGQRRLLTRAAQRVLDSWGIDPKRVLNYAEPRPAWMFDDGPKQPYLEINGPHGWLTIRKLTHMEPEDANKLVDSVEKAWKDIKEGNEIKILAVEKKFETVIDLSEELKNIKIRGKIDRIDSVNGVTRVIDYKTGGQIKQTDLNIKQYEEIFKDKKYSNVFQLLFYCLAIEDDKKYNFPVEAGIISFRSLDSGVIKTRFQDKTNLVSHEKIKEYKYGLDSLIKEVIHVDIPFTENRE